MTTSWKLCQLAALAAIAVAMMGGNAGASTFTSPAGTSFTGTVVANPASEHFVFDTAFGGVTTECGAWPLEFPTEFHGPAITAKGVAELILFVECTESRELTILNRGFLEFHALGNGNATVTSSSLEITSSTSVPIPGYHCKYKTNNNHFGTLTGSKNTGGNAVLDLAGALIPRTEASHPFCGSIEVTAGSFVVETPAYLDVS